MFRIRTLTVAALAVTLLLTSTSLAGLGSDKTMYLGSSEPSEAPRSNVDGLQEPSGSDQAPESPRSVLSSTQAFEYRLLATKRTSTMQKELNEAAGSGFRFVAVMKGNTGFGGAEIVSVLTRVAGVTIPRYEYKLLATSKTSTMQKEMQEAGDAGFEYRDQTVGGEVMTILERDLEAPIIRYEYKLLATKKTGTMQKELQESGEAGFEFVGVTVAPTTFGGSEVVTILRRKIAQ